MFRFDGEDFTLVAVVAAARNGVIGHRGAMPWRLPSDLKRYRMLTMGRPMVMGRKTLQAIGKVLDGRDTVVLTRSDCSWTEGAIEVSDPQVALEAAARCARARGTNEIVIVGGGQIYELFLPQTDRVEMTVVEAGPDGDTHFPELASDDWLRIEDAAMPRGEGDSADARFVTFQRMQSN